MAHGEEESPTTADAEEAPSRPLGRVESDGRGRNVWRWARGLIDSTSVLLKRLENPNLELEPTRKVKARVAEAARPGRQGPGRHAPSRPSAPSELTLEASAVRDAGGGFDPYNSR